MVKKFEVTPAHQAIFDALRDPKGGNISISAVAGSGKTSTILECLAILLALGAKSILFLAFNSRIAEELKGRVAWPAQVMTTHALAFLGLREYLRAQRNITTRVEPNKLRQLGEQLFKGAWPRIAAKTARLASLAKSSGLGTRLLADTPENWDALADHHGLFDDRDGPELRIDVMRAAPALLRRSNEVLDVIDYDDMQYLNVLLGAGVPQYAWVFVDEKQDLNLLQHEIVAMAMRPNGGRLVGVGDPHQAIYGFRGADASSMQTLVKRFNMRELPLHVSYRCAQSVVREAQKWVSHIQAHSGAPEGTVVRDAVPVEKAGVKVGDMVICRFTAPVVRAAFSFIREGVPAIVLGKDIGASLASTVKKLRADSITDAYEKLNLWSEREMAKAVAAKDEARQEKIIDRVEAVRTFLDVSNTIDECLARIEQMFSDDNPANVITCCTIHKSKGLEAERVFVVNVHKMPSKWAKKDWQLEQEKNLIYVAYTRSKLHLQFVLVGDEKLKKDAGPTLVQTGPKWVKVPGRTFPVKDQLKALGARWDADRKAWMVPEDKLDEANDIVEEGA